MGVLKIVFILIYSAGFVVCLMMAFPRNDDWEEKVLNDEDLEEEELTKEEAKRIAEEYLLKNGNEYVVRDVCDEPWERANAYSSKLDIERVYYVQCGRRQQRGLESSQVLIISRRDGNVLSFQSAHDEG